MPSGYHKQKSSSTNRERSSRDSGSLSLSQADLVHPHRDGRLSPSAVEEAKEHARNEKPRPMGAGFFRPEILNKDGRRVTKSPLTLGDFMANVIEAERKKAEAEKGSKSADTYSEVEVTSPVPVNFA